MEQILINFSTISLNEMSEIKLMNRIDTKYLTTKETLSEILKKASVSYLIQEINGCVNSNYYTVYYDTPSHEMYLEHQNGRMNRTKVRVRSYLDTEMAFLEVKRKNNKGRTDKKRVRLDDIDIKASDYNSFLSQCISYNPLSLEKQLENRFHRITLVNKDKTERLTIDTDLCFHNMKTDKLISLEDLVIIELKRDANCYSPIKSILNDCNVHPSGFSKYCIGLALTDKSLKQNRFKAKLHNINKIITEQNNLWKI